MSVAALNLIKYKDNTFIKDNRNRRMFAIEPEILRLTRSQNDGSMIKLLSNNFYLEHF